MAGWCWCCGEARADEGERRQGNGIEERLLDGEGERAQTSGSGGDQAGLGAGAQGAAEKGDKGLGEAKPLEEEPSSGMFENGRGIKLWEQRFEPKGGPACATILFVHGVHEHSTRYNHVFRRLAQELSVVVYSFDQQSHGRSEDVRGLRGACNSFEEFVDDVHSFLVKIRNEHPDIPRFLWGQSFGGLVSTFACLREPDMVSGLILSSPAINVEWSLTFRLQARAAGLASTFTPDVAAIPAVDPKHMSKDPKAVEDYVSDPLNTIGNLRARLGAEILGAFKTLERQRAALVVPHLLVLFGDADECCSLPKAREFFEAVPVPHKDLKVFPGMYHTLFHEPEQDEVVDYLVAWLRPLVDGASAEGAGAALPSTAATVQTA